MMGLVLKKRFNRKIILSMPAEERNRLNADTFLEKNLINHKLSKLYILLKFEFSEKELIILPKSLIKCIFLKMQPKNY